MEKESNNEIAELQFADDIAVKSEEKLNLMSLKPRQKTNWFLYVFFQPISKFVFDERPHKFFNYLHNNWYKCSLQILMTHHKYDHPCYSFFSSSVNQNNKKNYRIFFEQNYLQGIFIFLITPVASLIYLESFEFFPIPLQSFDSIPTYKNDINDKGIT